jgi:hypothetical protein
MAQHDVPVSRIGTILSPWARTYQRFLARSSKALALVVVRRRDG